MTDGNETYHGDHIKCIQILESLWCTSLKLIWYCISIILKKKRPTELQATHTDNPGQTPHFLKSLS